MRLQTTGQKDRRIERRTDSGNMRQLSQAHAELAPVLDAGARLLFEHADVGHGAEQVAFQRVFEAVIDGECDDQRHHPGRHPENRDGGDHGNDLFLAVCPEVPPSDEQLEFRGHGWSYSRKRSIRSIGPSGRSKGNRMTSRIVREPVKIIVMRSMPMPSPPVGGMP